MSQFYMDKCLKYKIKHLELKNMKIHEQIDGSNKNTLIHISEFPV